MLKRFSKAVVLFSTLLLLTAQLSFAANSFAGLSAFADDDDDSFLHPDKAFKLGVVAKDNSALEAIFTIAPGYYLYKDRIQFTIKDTALGAIKAVELPAGDMKDDPSFGAKEVYHHNFAASITIENAAKDVVIHARYQGCSEKGVCYAPQLKTLNIAMPDAEASNNVTSPAAATSNATAITNNEDEATTLLKSGTLWLIAVGFFGFGLLLSFTPCVLPMIPILSGIIVGDKKAHKAETSRLHSFNLSLAYVLGIALSYTVAGIAAGLSGHLLSNALQSPWVLTATSLVFVVLSFSMFGFYELRLPSAIEERMVNTTNKLKGGQLLGVFAMGVISALIVSPCVAAPLAGALIYISQTRDVVLGGVALFALSIGMGVPLLLIGASAGHILPKAGGWMTAVRNAFGLLMLAVAIFIVSPIIPMSIQLGLWSALLIIPAIYLHALDSPPLDSTTGRSQPWMGLWRGVSIMLLIMGIALLIGALSGAKSPLQPLSGLSLSNNKQTQNHLPFIRVKNAADLDARINEANGKIVMLDFYADWCTSCKEMELLTLSNPDVQAALKGAVLLQADVTDNTPEDIALLQRFNLYGPPAIVFFSRSGQEIKLTRVIGYEGASTFLASINRVNSLKADECNPLPAC